MALAHGPFLACPYVKLEFKWTKHVGPLSLRTTFFSFIFFLVLSLFYYKLSN